MVINYAMIHGLVRWGQNGTPIFSLDADLAIQLMATDVARVDLSQIRHPFTAYMIQIPKGLLTFISPQGRESVVYVIVSTGTAYFGPRTASGRIEVCDRAFSPEGVYEAPSLFFQMMNETAGALYALNRAQPGDVADLNETDAIGEFGNFIRMSRLAIGFPLYLASLGLDRKKLAEHRRPFKVKKLPPGAVAPQVYDVKSTVRLTQPQREAYMSSDRASFEIRTRHLVRGHWRNQPCGPRNSERKYLWIQPFWRGPEDGPQVTARNYTTGDT